jgi:hypothetical protein
MAMEGAARLSLTKAGPRLAAALSLPGGVLADLWFSVVHGRSASWVAFR